MKLLSKTALVILTVISMGACSSNRMMTSTNADVRSLSGNANIPEGSIVYGLPLTVFDITIETERTVQRPGPYAAYAEDMLGLKDVIKTDGERWTIRGIAIKTHEELDPSEYYLIDASSIFRTNVLTLKKEGLILDLNPEIYNREALHPGNNSRESLIQHVYDLGSDEYFESRNDTVYKLVNVDTSFIRIPYLVEKKQKLSIDQLAEKAATRLMELRDGKHSILTGEANVFPQNGAAIDEINKLERDHLELFAGKTWKEKRNFTYQLIPAKGQSDKPVVICGFSEKAGPVSPSGKYDLLLQAEFVPEHKTKPLTVLSTQQKQQPNRLYYRVPEVVNVKISFGNEPVSITRKLVYQLGDIVQLPVNYIIGN